MKKKLYLISFFESIFFPVPTDIFLIPKALINKERAVKLAIYTTIFSVLGGVLGYFIGAFFFDVGMQIMSFYGYEDKLNHLKNNLINKKDSIEYNSYHAFKNIISIRKAQPAFHPNATQFTLNLDNNIFLTSFRKVAKNIM